MKKKTTYTYIPKFNMTVMATLAPLESYTTEDLESFIAKREALVAQGETHFQESINEAKAELKRRQN